MGDTILYRSGGGGGSLSGYPVGNVTNFKVVPADTTAAITWTDPEDISTSGGAVIKWNSTRIVRKLGSFPTSEIDGTIVVESTVKNQYKTNEFIDAGLTEGTTYYYAAFSCSDYGIYSRVPETMSVTTVRYRVMTVVIDESNRNPDTCCTYADDAVGMLSGVSNERAIQLWQEFFKYKPCLVCGEDILGYLDPNDWTKLENGEASGYVDEVELPTISNYTTSKLYHAGKQKMMHVFIEIPILGIRISKSGNKVTVSITDNPNASGYIYYPFYYKGVKYDRLYINTANSHPDGDVFFDSPWVPLGFTQDDRGSLSGKSSKQSILDSIQNDIVGTSRYGFMSYYQLLLIQCMTILQFKSIGSSIIHDLSSKDSNSATTGMFYIGPSTDIKDYPPDYQYHQGSITEYTLFGLRCIITKSHAIDTPQLGYITLLDGASRGRVSMGDGNFYLCQDGNYSSNWDDTTGYVSTPAIISYGEDGPYISKVNGSNTAGFIPTECNGSSTTYYLGGYRYCSSSLSNAIMGTGCFYNRNTRDSYYGIFSIIETASNDGASPYCGVRTVFLK